MPAAAALLLGALLLLSIPVEFAFDVRRHDRARAQVMFRWLFGVVAFPIAPSYRRRRPRNKAKPRRPGRLEWSRVVGALRDPAFRRAAGRFLRRTFSAIHLRRFRLWLRLGLDDPADTGLAWAVAGPAIALLDRRGAVDAAPRFNGESLEFETQGIVWFVPSFLAVAAIAFALSPAAVRAVIRHGVRA
ncbi:MAG: DUF2953 domain-containing protein [Bryobacteraceae bacterium]